MIYCSNKYPGDQMKIYTLKTTIGGRITEQKFSADKPIQIQAQQDAQYELVDENGNVLQPIKENDTWKWLNPENEEVVVQIEHYQPSKLATVSESHAIAPEVIPVKSAVLASEIGIGKAVLWGLGGLLGAGGIALAASGGKGGGDSNSQHEADKPKALDTNNTTAISNTIDTVSSKTEETPNSSAVVELSTSTNVEESASSTETNETTTDNRTEESAPIEIPTPIIHFDPITEDNIINLAESKQKAVTISGHVEHANEGDIVHFRIGEAKYTAELEQGKFSVNVDGQTLANHHSISATVQTHNQEGSATAKGTAQKEYEVDIIAPQPTLVLDNIAGDNVVNRTEATGKIQISGITTEVADGAKVVVACGCPSCLARLGVEALEKTAVVTSGRFSVEFDGSDLVADGRHIITARVVVQDKAGNVGEAEDNKGYSVEISHSEASLVWDKVTDDNIINQQESQNNVTLSGSISNVKEGDKVQVRINIGNEVLEATVDNGHYSVSVDGNKLVSHPPLEAVLIITDKFGNTTTKNIQHQYDVDTAITSPEIQISPINQGNSLNQQQSLSAVTISGNLTLDSDIDSTRTKVTVVVHGESYSATINGNQWQAVVPGNKLAKEQGENTASVKVVVTDNAGNSAEYSKNITYHVDTVAPTPAPSEPEELKPTAEIRLNNIAPEVMEDSDFIRLSGKVKLEGVFTHGHNEHHLHAVTIKIGEKSYRSAVDPRTQRFVVDIPESDLPFIQDKEVSYLFDADKQIYELAASEHVDYYVKPINTPTLDASHIIWDTNMPITGNLFNLAADKRSHVEISGKVSGDVQAGEKLILSIGDNHFETTVNTNLTFRHAVPKELLADNDRVKVVLQRNNVDKANTEVLLSKAPELSGKFVSKHELEPYTDGDRPYFINSLLMEGNQTRYPIYHKERVPLVFDHPVVMRYNIIDGYHSFKEKDIEGVKKALDIISEYTNISFEKTDSISQDDVELRFYLTGIRSGSTVSAYTTHVNDAEVSNVYMGTRLLNDRTLSLSDDYPLKVLLHEILHALGGKHPHEGRALMPYKEDSRILSVLSYKDRYLATPQLGIFDIAFLHYRYGVNQNVRKGNDVYRFRPASDHSVERDVYIWDGGGVDTFDASDQAQSVNVNLTPGSWIYSGQKTDTFLMTATHTTLYDANAYFEKPANVRINGGVGFLHLNHYTKGQAFIGYGTQIEKLIGSDFDDTLTGNNADNTIYGGKGNDIINGGGGNDYLDGGLGVDTLSGGIGDDIYVVNENRDSVRENADEGNDTVHSYINYTLTSNVENLSLFGAENLSATGNNLNNIIIGNNSDNRLDGKEGTDILKGGKGRDIFIFSSSLNGEIDTITDFTVGEDKIGLSRDIFLSIRTEDDIRSHMHYEKATGELFYSQDTIGKGTHFATISSNLLIDEHSFMIV